jgi:hypothetical protein
MRSHTTFLSAFAALFALAASQQQCFGLNGTPLDDSFAPCNPGAKHSGCCATKRSTGADVCLDSGLCMSTRGEFAGMIWQAGCTDRTGKDIACPKMCPSSMFQSITQRILKLTKAVEPNSIGNPDAITSWNVQQCDYGVYCCRANNDRASCCNSDTAPKITVSSIGALQIAAATATPSPSTSRSAQVTATAVATGTPFDATAAPIVSDCKKEKNQAAVVGGAVGGVLGAIIFVLAGAMFWLHRREAHQRRLKEHYQEQIAQSAAYRRRLASNISLVGSEMEMHSKSPES